MNATPLICVVYDSIKNSVFQGQVLAPLQRKLANKHVQEVVIISFEPDALSTHEIATIIPPHEKIRVIILNRPALWSKKSLKKPRLELAAILATFSTYRIIARGPIAGLLCMQATTAPACLSLTIQARGLLAAEYAFTHRGTKNMFKRIAFSWRTRQYTELERATYNRKFTKPSMSIEAVSDALKDYLITQYGADPRRVTIAHDDLPPVPTAEELAAWRIAMRATLNLTHDTHVYCYNGSVKPWQCPQETIDYFVAQHEKNARSFLLVLTQETELFEQLLSATTLPSTVYRVIHAPHNEIYHYLAACDTGIIFRESHAINWVSRPTKVLEYQAARLAIAHNNTIAFLSKPTTHTAPPIASE